MLLGPMPSVRLTTLWKKPQKQDVSAWLGSSRSFCQEISTLIPATPTAEKDADTCGRLLDAPQHPCHVTLPLSTHGASKNWHKVGFFPESRTYCPFIERVVQCPSSRNFCGWCLSVPIPHRKWLPVQKPSSSLCCSIKSYIKIRTKRPARRQCIRSKWVS